MILTTKTRYAVMAVIEIADDKENRPVSLLTISKKQDISLSYLEQIFVHLKKAEIVKAHKGPGGGYILVKSPKETTIAEIIKAIGESMKMTRCNNIKKSCVASGKKCRTHQLWHGLENKINEYLSSVTIGDMC